MYGFKKFLVSLIPLILLVGLLFLLQYKIYGLPSWKNSLFVYLGVTIGLLVQFSFLNESEIHPVWKVFAWIGFGLMVLATLLATISIASSVLDTKTDPLLFHFSIGVLCGSALTIIYCFIVVALGFGEEHSVSSKVIVPLILFIGGTIGGGYIKYGSDKLIQTLSYVFAFAPLGLIILLIILFARLDLMGACYNEGSSSGSYRSSNSYSYSSDDDGPSDTTIRYALIGLSASYNIGCTVTLEIVDATVVGDSISLDIEESVEHPAYGTEDYGGARYNAEKQLYRKANQKLREIGANYSIS